MPKSNAMDYSRVEVQEVRASSFSIQASSDYDTA